MKTKFKKRLGTVTVAVTALLLSTLLAGCEAFNDNGLSSSGSLTVSVTDLQGQLGFLRDSNGVFLPTSDTPATSQVEALVVGAIVIRSRSEAEGPYTAETPITSINDQLSQDIQDSGNNLVLVPLTQGEVVESVDVPMPNPGSDKYQILAAALDHNPGTIENMATTAGQDAIKYIGFNQEFLETTPGWDMNVYGTDTPAAITLEMKRACLIGNPQDQATMPKGCARFFPSGFFSVSSAVEILSVVDENGVEIAPNGASYPLIVRADPDAPNEYTPATVYSTQFAQGAGPLPAVSAASRLTVTVSHMLANDASAACSALENTSPTVAAILASCETTTYVTVK